MSPEVPTGTGTRAAVALTTLAAVAVVLLTATAGTFLVAAVAGTTCNPDGQGPSCPRTTVLPLANLGLQVLLLVAGLAGGAVWRARTRTPGGAIGATVAVGLAMALVSVLVVSILLGLAGS